MLTLGWLLWLSSRNRLLWCGDTCYFWRICCISKDTTDEDWRAGSSKSLFEIPSMQASFIVICFDQLIHPGPSYYLLIFYFVFKVVQLLETPLVNLINYASLVATNAARHRFVAGKSKVLLEFGLRRAHVRWTSYLIPLWILIFVIPH